jgi:hypothetical protein
VNVHERASRYRGPQLYEKGLGRDAAVTHLLCFRFIPVPLLVLVRVVLSFENTTIFLYMPCLAHKTYICQGRQGEDNVTRSLRLT